MKKSKHYGDIGNFASYLNNDFGFGKSADMTQYSDDSNMFDMGYGKPNKDIIIKAKRKKMYNTMHDRELKLRNGEAPLSAEELDNYNRGKNILGGNYY